MIGDHIRFLLRRDESFAATWEGLTEAERHDFKALAARIERVPVSRWKVSRAHLQAAELTKRLFLVVPNQEFHWSRVPPDWLEFVRDVDAKRRLFTDAMQALGEFVASRAERPEVKLYGNIKSD